MPWEKGHPAETERLIFLRPAIGQGLPRLVSANTRLRALRSAAGHKDFDAAQERREP